MADHMRRNDKLRALTASASQANERARQNTSARDSEAETPRTTPRQAPRQNQPSRRSAQGARQAAPASRRNAAGHARQGSPKGTLTIAEFFKRNATYILSVVAVVVLVVLMIFFIRACAPQSQPAEVEEAPYSSPYDWSKLDRTDNRYSYVVNGQVKSHLGIDVSESQHYIDWQAVADDGIEFAMIRLGYRGATEGDLYLDNYYLANIEGARNAGIECGIYFFSQATTVDEAIEEAEFVLDSLGGIELEYPIAYDSEVVSDLGITRTANLSQDEMTAIADAFCNRIEQAGYKTLVYGNAGDLSRYHNEIVDDGGVWWAEYDSSVPHHYLDIVMWQYSNAGEIAGIETHVDMNIDLVEALK